MRTFVQDFITRLNGHALTTEECDAITQAAARRCLTEFDPTSIDQIITVLKGIRCDDPSKDAGTIVFDEAVYECFDRVENHTEMTAETNPHAIIHIGMDFNFEHCAAVAHVCDSNDDPHAVWEFIDLFNTEKMCQAIKARFPNRRVVIYPDPSGKNRNAAGLSTSHAIIRQHGFEIKVPNRHPSVWSRVNSMNAMFLAANGKRRYKVNTKLCPTYTKCLERQGWKDGEPDKSNNIDHPLDAGGYFIHFKYALQVALGAKEPNAS